MRILQVIHDFVPNHVAGSELYCYYLSSALAARRHSVHVLFTELDCSRPQYAYRRFDRGALTCHEVVHNREYRTFAETYLNAHMDARFEQLLDAEMPDVVHLHHLMHHSLNYPKLARARGIPVVFTLHDYWLSCLNYGQRLHSQHGVCEEIDIGLCADCVSRFPVAPPLAAAFRRALTRRAHGPSDDATHAARESGSQALLRGAKAIYRGVMKQLTPATSRMVLAARRLEAVRVAWREVDLFLAPSTFLAERMIEFGLPAQRVVRSPNGMRDDLLQIHTRKTSDRLRFGYVGSVAPHKGVHVLVEAFAKFAERSRCPVELRIHGSLTQRPDYVSRLRTLAGTAPVVFLGEFDNAVAGQVYAEMDALVIPSIWWENAPLTLFEARLAGKPVIASDGGSLPDLIDSHDTLFKQGDADDLARCLAAFAERPRLVSPMAQGRRVKTMEQDAREMEQRYEGLLAAAPLPYLSTAVADLRP